MVVTKACMVPKGGIMWDNPRIPYTMILWQLSNCISALLYLFSLRNQVRISFLHFHSGIGVGSVCSHHWRTLSFVLPPNLPGLPTVSGGKTFMRKPNCKCRQIWLLWVDYMLWMWQYTTYLVFIYYSCPLLVQASPVDLYLSQSWTCMISAGTPTLMSPTFWQLQLADCQHSTCRNNICMVCGKTTVISLACR